MKIYIAKGKLSQDILHDKRFKKICILNFADWSRPGGTYNTTEVEWTQEETLCRDIPGLYEDLQRQGYNWKEKDYIWSDFEEFAVLSCPAPLTGSMRPKAKIILDAMEEHGVKWPVIGWWGCGVYGRSKKECLMAFNWALNNGNYSFFGVIWPDP